MRVKFVLAGNSSLLDLAPLPSIGAGTGGDNASTGLSQGQASWASRSEASSVRSNGNNGNGQKRDKHGNMTALAAGGKSKLYQSASSSGSLSEDPEAALNNVLEKIRRHKNRSGGWTEEKIRDLAHSK